MSLQNKTKLDSGSLNIIEIIMVHRVIVGKSLESAGKSPIIFGEERFFLFFVAPQSRVVVSPSVLYGDESHSFEHARVHLSD